MTELHCHVCGAPGPAEFPAYAELSRVTSDNRVWPKGGRMAWCAGCDCVQAVLDRNWTEQAAEIYGSYDLHRNSAGGEQSVRDPASRQVVSRSGSILGRLRDRLPATGALLDVGCGKGAFLAAASHALPAWRLFGNDINDRSRTSVEGIRGVERLYVGGLDAVEGRFELVSLIHSFEHIPEPAAFLGRLWDLLVPGGVLLVQVPDCEVNPLVYLVAEHASHFFPSSLRTVVESAGYEVVVCAGDWLPKEITCVARRPDGPAERRKPEATRSSRAVVERQLAWIAKTAGDLRALRGRPSVGVFGTTFAGTWFFGELDGRVDFFVDEDPNKIGQVHLGRPILAPDRIPPGSDVVLAFPRRFAAEIVERLRGLEGVRWHMPDDVGTEAK